jgi:hypothetical protein
MCRLAQCFNAVFWMFGLKIASASPSEVAFTIWILLPVQVEFFPVARSYWRSQVFDYCCSGQSLDDAFWRAFTVDRQYHQ